MEGTHGPARWLFTGRAGGVSLPPFDTLNLADHVGDDPVAVQENRRRAAARLGAGSLRLMSPTHGRDVAVVGEGDAEPPRVDALVTTMPGIALLAPAADCVPVLLLSAGAVAAVHSGWRGVRDDVVGSAVAALAAAGGADPIAVIGPAICGECYAVPAARVDEVAAAAPRAASTTPDGRPALDLPRAVRARLEGLGVRVRDVGVCTAESPAHFSYRRDGVTGRQAGLVMIGP